MRVVIWIADTAIEMTTRENGGPHPWLVGISDVLLAARAGHLSGVGVGETPNMTIDIDNEDRQAATLLGRCLRARVDVYYPTDLLMTGIVQAIVYGRTLTLTVEA